MKNVKTMISTVIALILAVLLLNPSLLPFSADTKETMSELITSHFLIERSGTITLAHVLVCVLAVSLIWLCYSVLKLLLTLFGNRDDHARTMTSMLTELIKYIALIIAFVWGLAILGVNTTAVLAGAGIIGLIIGFGAQSLLEDIITGMFIIFEGQYSIGDIIILDDFRGTVRKIGVRTTVIEDAGGNLKVVNNSDIRNFQNRSRNQSLAVTDISVSYGTDLRRLEKIIAANLPVIYEGRKDVYLAVPRYLGVQKLADSGVELRFVADCKEENVFAVQRALNRDIKILFDEMSIEIPFPQIVVHKGE